MKPYWVKTPDWLKKRLPESLIWDMPLTAEPTVYITFDDGPHPIATPFALQQLAKYSAKATFFCVGANVERYPDLFEAIVAAGHAVANHTFNHLNGWKTDTATYLVNIALADKLIGSRAFRPPYGKLTPAQLKALTNSDNPMKIYMWDVLSADFDQTIDAAQCTKNVTANIKPGSIALFHDSEKSWRLMSATLPDTLHHCQKKNWQMKALPTT
jgi:peptidoglycan/xylan/chitin deacetylase (PgdA/CDA1 family)